MVNGICSVSWGGTIVDELVHDRTGFRVVREAVVYECCPTVYPFILFTIQIRRRTLYYVVNVVGKAPER